MNAAASSLPEVDYRLAFDLAPVGLALSRQRIMVDCNQALCDMFGASREQLVGQSFQILYPSADEYERTGERMAPLLGRSGTYADDRIMKRVGGQSQGETFWCMHRLPARPGNLDVIAQTTEAQVRIQST